MGKTYHITEEQAKEVIELLADLYVECRRDIAIHDSERHDDGGNWDYDTARMQYSMDKAQRVLHCADMFGGFDKSVYDRAHTAFYGW